MRVLVVEDEVKMAGLLKRALEEEGYAVDVAGRGEDALWLGTENPYDAIVLDLMLPEMDGHEVYRRLQEDPLLRAIPVVFLTARALDTTPIAPGVRYMTKPFDVQVLIETVRGSIEGAGA